MKNKLIVILLVFILIMVGLVIGNNIYTSLDKSSSIKLQAETEKQIKEEDLEIEALIEENPELSGIVREPKHNEKELVASSSELVYYSQIDSDWRWHPYTSIGDYSQTIGTSGCGPTSAAMIVSSIRGVVYPDEMGDLYVDNGFRSAHDGTYLSAFAWTADYYDIEFEQTYDIDEAVDLLNNNYMMVASCGPGLFTTGGHLIAIMGIDGDTLIIHDPYLYDGKFDSYGRSGKVDVVGDTVYCSIDNFDSYANCKGFYAFYDDGEPAPVPPAPAPEPEPQPVPVGEIVKVVIAEIGLNVRSGPSTDYPRLYGLPYGAEVVVYNEVGDWSEIGDGEYVASEYLADVDVPTALTGVVYDIVSSLNIRSGPGTNYRVIGSLYDGDVVDIYDEVNGFYNIGVNEWASSDYIYVDGDYDEDSIVGTTQRLAYYTILYSNSDLTGREYQYLPNTTVEILDRDGNVDFVRVLQTGREAYLDNEEAYQ